MTSLFAFRKIRVVAENGDIILKSLETSVYVE